MMGGGRPEVADGKAQRHASRGNRITPAAYSRASPCLSVGFNYTQTQNFSSSPKVFNEHVPASGIVFRTCSPNASLHFFRGPTTPQFQKLSPAFSSCRWLALMIHSLACRKLGLSSGFLGSFGYHRCRSASVQRRKRGHWWGE